MLQFFIDGLGDEIIKQTASIFSKHKYFLRHHSNKNYTTKHTTTIYYCNDDDKHIDYNGIDHDNNKGNDDNMIRKIVMISKRER